MLKKTLAVAAVTAAATMSLTGTASAHVEEDLILSDDQLVVAADIPANVCGTAIALLGSASTVCWTPAVGVTD